VFTSIFSANFIDQALSPKPCHRKDAKNAKKSKKIDGENPKCAAPAFVASIGYPGIERHEPLFPVVRVSFALFASLR
jgi:hypothetical protein